MSIALPTQAAGGIAPEYAATNTYFRRTNRLVNGEMIAVFTCDIDYQRVDFVMQNGKKIGVLSTDQNDLPGMPGQKEDARYGHIHIDPEQFAALAGSVEPGNSLGLFEDLTGLVDGLIRLDLINRKIITE